MSEEDTELSHCMIKLKIMPKPKQLKLYRDDNLPLKLNPFAKRSKTMISRLSLFDPTYLRRKNRVCKNILSTKNKSKLLRDPIIILPEKCKHKHSDTLKSDKSKSELKSVSELFGDNSTHQDFRSIIAGCEQLSLTNDDGLQTFPNQNFREVQSPTTSRTENRELSSCSQQAMARLCLNPPCDVTIDELACYFETFVHIPKKMSSMAEMMYI